jgi:hypothetical protein
MTRRKEGSSSIINNFRSGLAFLWLERSTAIMLCTPFHPSHAVISEAGPFLSMWIFSVGIEENLRISPQYLAQKCVENRVENTCKSGLMFVDFTEIYIYPKQA